MKRSVPSNKVLPPAKCKKVRLFYTNKAKHQAYLILSFLITIIIVQSAFLGAMSVIIWRTSNDQTIQGG